MKGCFMWKRKLLAILFAFSVGMVTMGADIDCEVEEDDCDFFCDKLILAD